LIMYASIISMIINIILCFLLIKPYGIAGAAISTSIASACSVVILSISIGKVLKNKTTASMNFSLFMIKAAAASFISLTVSKLFLHYVPDSKLSIMLSIGLGALIYLLIAYLLRIEEFQQIILLLRKRKD
jgi:putative peptidoglycan lipid II flippase